MNAWTYDTLCTCSQQQLTIIGYNILYHLHFANMHSPTISPSFNIYALININYIIQLNNSIQFLKIQVKEKIHHTMINIVFNTYQSFIHLHIIISNYSQKICKVFGLKDHWQSSSIILQSWNKWDNWIKTKQTSSSASTIYTLRSHMSAVEYTCAFHRPSATKS